MMPRGAEGCQVRTVIAGTRNPAKVAMLRALLDGIAIVTPPPGTSSPDFREAEGEIADVARGKAMAWSRWLRDLGCGDPVIVTDGGLIVPGLGDAWRPARTRRFAGPGAAPVEIARALLALTASLRGEDRRIGWREAAVIVGSDAIPRVFEADGPPGVLATTLREADLEGDDGFWVPAVWRCPEFGLKRLCNLTPEETAAREDHWDRLGRCLRGELSNRPVAGEDGG